MYRVLVYIDNQRATSPLKIGLDVIQSHSLRRMHFRPILHWGDREMGTAISCTECSQMAGLIQKVVENP